LQKIKSGADYKKEGQSIEVYSVSRLFTRKQYNLLSFSFLAGLLTRSFVSKLLPVYQALLSINSGSQLQNLFVMAVNPY